jgi:non-specific serine/threonine protein kinase
MPSPTEAIMRQMVIERPATSGLAERSASALVAGGRSPGAAAVNDPMDAIRVMGAPRSRQTAAPSRKEMTLELVTAHRNSSPAVEVLPDDGHWPSTSRPLGAQRIQMIRYCLPVESARPEANAFRFGRFSLIRHSRQLFSSGAPVRLGNRAIDVLFVLIEANGQLVTKDELMNRAWPTVTVEENCLQFQISALRKALGKDRDFINTVSGRGYRFIAEVSSAGPATDRDPKGVTFRDAESVTFRRAESATFDSNAQMGTSDRNAANIVRLRLAQSPGNLPANVTEIVGRESDVLDAASVVMSNRLVTLVGTGGIGKTRLATELGRHLMPKFTDGVYVVDLGPASHPGLVLPAVAAALGLAGGDMETPERLAAALAAKRLLIVLDNCEHVIDAAAAAAEALLHANGSLRVIATSREPLRADGEFVYRLPPLDVPPEGAQDLEQVRRHGAAKLFIARTCANDPVTPLDNRQCAAITKICRRLDGIPLAIELAAASAAAMGVGALASRLDDHLSLLADGRRTAPPRHRTLRAAIDWSYDPLSEAERPILRRLAVFAGDFTLEAAVAVGANGADVVRCLAALVSKSLIVREFDGTVPRYRLLETMRAYAMEKLRESGEFETTAACLADWHQSEAVALDPHRSPAGQ